MRGSELITRFLLHSPSSATSGWSCARSRRGSSLCFCEVEVSGAVDGALVATGLVAYKLG